MSISLKLAQARHEFNAYFIKKNLRRRAITYLSFITTGSIV